MEVWMYLLITLGIAWIVGMIIAYIAHYKSYKKILNPLTYFKGILFALLRVPKSFFGIGPKSVDGLRDRADGHYAIISQQQADEALNFARSEMKKVGLILSNYKHRQFDCDDFSLAMIHYAKLYMLHNYSKSIGQKGIPFGVIGYTRKDLVGHQIVQVFINNKRTFYEPYPEDKYKTKMKLSTDEIKSIEFDTM